MPLVTRAKSSKNLALRVIEGEIMTTQSPPAYQCKPKWDTDCPLHVTYKVIQTIQVICRLHKRLDGFGDQAPEHVDKSKMKMLKRKINHDNNDEKNDDG